MLALRDCLPFDFMVEYTQYVLLLICVFVYKLLSCGRLIIIPRRRLGRYAFKPFVFTEIETVPFPRYHHPTAPPTMGSDISNVYFFGEFKDGVILFNPVKVVRPAFYALWKYNIASKKWTKLNFEGLEIASYSRVLHQNTLMVYIDPIPSEFFNTMLFILHINEESGRMKVAVVPRMQPCPIFGHSYFTHKGQVYALHGNGLGAKKNSIYRFNRDKRSWVTVYESVDDVEFEPEERHSHHFCCKDNIIYIVGGLLAFQRTETWEYVPAFDLDKKVWFRQETTPDAKKGYPLPRQWIPAVQPSAAKSGYQVFLNTDYRNEVWTLNLETFQWKYLKSCKLPPSLSVQACSVTPEGRLFVYTRSYDGTQWNYLNRIFYTWLEVPKLSEMCWEAVTSYFPGICEVGRDEAIRLGVPVRFLNRLGK